MSGARRFLTAHFEACVHASFWVSASCLAALAGRPWLGAIGLVTVAPILALYVARVRRRTDGVA